MVTEPVLENRGAQNYVAIRKRVNMNDIPAVLPPLIPEVITWLNENNLNAAGLCFFHYEAMTNHDELDVAVGLLVPEPVMGNGHMVTGAFPAGRYASILYTGDYQNMMEGHKALEDWISNNGLQEMRQNTDEGIKWGGRTEFYLTDPDTEPDPEKWKTEIIFLMEDL
ncbi:MAG: GyrI-like domain-containing protein [Ferruginibacter sp.]